MLRTRATVWSPRSDLFTYYQKKVQVETSLDLFFFHITNRTLNSSTHVQYMSIHGKGWWTFYWAKECLQENNNWSDAVVIFRCILGLLNTNNFINFCDKLNLDRNTHASKSKRVHFWMDQCMNFNKGPICLVQWVVCLRSSKRS